MKTCKILEYVYEMHELKFKEYEFWEMIERLAIKQWGQFHLCSTETRFYYVLCRTLSFLYACTGQKYAKIIALL